MHHKGWKANAWRWWHGRLVLRNWQRQLISFDGFKSSYSHPSRLEALLGEATMSHTGRGTLHISVTVAPHHRPPSATQVNLVVRGLLRKVSVFIAAS
jgi:hypothetical protein